MGIVPVVETSNSPQDVSIREASQRQIHRATRQPRPSESERLGTNEASNNAQALRNPVADDDDERRGAQMCLLFGIDFWGIDSIKASSFDRGRRQSNLPLLDLFDKQPSRVVAEPRRSIERFWRVSPPRHRME
jgi:hypothetical protein